MDKQIIEKLNPFFRNNADKYGIGAAFIFGSCAEGMDGGYSDIDVAVYFRDVLSSDEMLSRIAEINIEIVKIIQREIDIIWIGHELSKPMLYYNAIVKGIPLPLPAHCLLLTIHCSLYCRHPAFRLSCRIFLDSNGNLQ